MPNCEGHSCTCPATGPTQSLDELDFERGIWSAALNGDLNRVKQLLNRARTNVDQKDNYDYTALHYAARNGHLEICKYLVENGANVNAVTRSGLSTPLHRACSGGHTEIVKFLLQNKGKAELLDSDGKSALDKAIENNHKDVIEIVKKYLENK